jgi:hypothetical protein
VFHPVKRWMAATLDGMVEGTGAVFEAKFMLPWAFSENGAAEKHMAQLQHNMWVTASRTAVLSIITGGGKWVELTIPADPLYQHLLLTAEEVLALRRLARSHTSAAASRRQRRGGPDRRQVVHAWLSLQAYLGEPAGSQDHDDQSRVEGPGAGGCQKLRSRRPCEAPTFSTGGVAVAWLRPIQIANLVSPPPPSVVPGRRGS